ncbi:MAG: hypothetical protein QXV17_02740 [Candidatus Micrarchaeaceae archaeon]
MASGSMQPRNLLVMSGLQLVTRGKVTWAEKESWLRNPPYTAVHPTPGQMEIRIKFGETAHAAKGQRGTRAITKGKKTGKIVPAVAAHIAENPLGLAPSRLDPELYPSKLRRTVHTLEELKEMYARKTGKAAPGPY